jgi:WD40 repeat protein
MVILTSTTLVFYQQANTQRAIATENAATAQIRALAAQALTTSFGVNLDERLLLGLLAVHKSGSNLRYEAHNSLLTLLQGNRDIVGYLHTPNARVGDGSIRLAESADGNTLVSYSGAGLFVWDMSQQPITPRPLPLPRHYDDPNSTLVAISADGHYVAVAGANVTPSSVEAEMSVISVATGQAVATYPGFMPTQITLSADGKKLAASYFFQTGQCNLACPVHVVIWAVDSDPQHPSAQITTDHAVNRLAFNNTGALLALGEDSGTLVWNLAAGHVSDIAEIGLSGASDDTQPNDGLAFSTDGNWLVASGESTQGIFGETDIFKVQNGRFSLAATLPEQGEITAPRNGSFYLASCTDILVCTQVTFKTVVIDPFSTRYVNTLDGVGIFAHIAFVAGVNRMAISTDNGSILLWQLPFEDYSDSTALPESSIPESFFSPHGQVVAFFHNDGTLGLWNARSDKELTDTPQTQGILHGDATIKTVGVSNDSAEVAALEKSGEILVHRRSGVTRLLDPPHILADPLEERALLELAIDWTGQHVAALTCVQPDGSCATVEVDIWDTATGKRIAQRTFTTGASIAFTPAGTTLAIGQLNAVAFYDYAKNVVTTPIDVSEVGIVDTLAFDPAGKTMAAVSDLVRDSTTPSSEFGINQYLLQWDVGTGKALGLLQAPSAAPDGLSFDAQGNLYGLAGSFIYRFDYSLASLTKSACAIANRNLTRAEWQQFAGDEPYVKLCRGLP